MENFVVSARKYRPMTFETVIGQEHITQTLKNAIRNNKLAHAFLFCGPRGVGKTTCARILAKTINCTNLTTEIEACNECESCRTFNQNASFNIYELDAASNNSVDDIRALAEQVRYAPQGAKYKIYIIDEVHMLSSAAFNAFLKTLEEPPPYAKFILATTERHKILPTILSRCQVFDFHRIKIEHAVTQLKKICVSEEITAEEEALHVIAQKADGAMRDALSIFDRIVSYSGKHVSYQDVITNLNILDYEYYFKTTDKLLEKNTAETLLLFDDVLNNGFDVQHFLSGLNEHIRNLMVCKHHDTIKLLEVPQTIATKFLQQSALCSQSFLLNALNIINKCEVDLRSSRNSRLHVELYLLKLAHIQTLLEAKSAEAGAKKKMIEQAEMLTPEKEPAPKLNPPIPPANPGKERVDFPKSKSEFDTNNGRSAEDKLKSLRNKVASEPTEKKDQPASQAQQPDFTEMTVAISATTLDHGIKAYIQKLENDGKMSMAVIYKNATYEVLSDNEFIFTLASKHEDEMLQKDNLPFMQFLRNEVKNYNLNYKTNVDSKIQVERIFTADDKFKEMMRNNPALLEFRNTFELDID
jgi:DNA polymerase-3 subunit gamma/tau